MKPINSNDFVQPLDNLFDVMKDDEQEPTDMAEYVQVEGGALAVAATQEPAELDEEDVEVNRKIDEVYDAALGTFQNQMAYTEIIEPRYAARNAEVAASYLNIALNAAGMRAKVKADRKRNAGFVPFGGKTTNNTIVATRDEIMRMISVDADTKEI